MAFEVGTKLIYDFAYFLRWYALENYKVNPIQECTILENDKERETIVVNTKFDQEIEFNDKAYGLCRCQRLNDGSWNLLVIKDPKLVVQVVE